ncbi:hypothetical protein [Paraburkholderia xenovorans]|jgi:hypothetical protein
MTTLSVAGFTIGGLDSVTSVADASAKLNQNPGDPKLIAAYDAALANAAATFAAGIPGEGAVFAGNAIIANLNNLTLNSSGMSSTDKASVFTAMAGELITLAGQGVSFLGLAEMQLNRIVGGTTFTVGEIINGLGYLATAVGAGIDSGTIWSIVQQQFHSSGLVPDSQGNYSASAFSSSNFICDALNASAMFDIVKGNNVSLDLPTIYVDGGNVATVVVGDAPNGRDVIYSSGLAGPGLRLVVEGSGNSVTLQQGSSIQMDATQSNTVHNAVTGDTYTVSKGVITGANGSTISAGSTDVFSLNSQGSQTVATYNAGAQQTGQATFGAGGKLTQDLFYDATSGRLTQENDFNADGSQVDHIFNANGTQTAYMFNASGHETEQATFGINGVKTQDVFFDATSGRETQENDFNADGSQVDHVFNANGTQTSYAFNAAGHETGQATFGTNGAKTQDVFFDATSGRETQENDFNADGSQVDHIFNANGTQNTAVINAAGHETEYASFGANGKITQDQLFDATSGRLTQENDYNADGSQVDHIFNANGTQTAYAFNAAGHETGQATFGTNGVKTQDLFYDATSGRLTQENNFNADGSQVDHIFNTNGTQTAYAFNATGHETEQATFGTNGKITQDLVFDGSTGRELQETDYNANGSGVAHIFNPDGTQTAAVFDPSGHVSEYATYGTNGKISTDAFFDANGRETQLNQYAGNQTTVHIINADNTQTATVYNSANQETEFARFDAHGHKTDDYFFNGPTGRETEYDHYGSDGSMVANIFHSDNSQDQIIYNASGQETQYQAYNSQGQLTGFTNFTYNVGGGYNAVAYGPSGYETGWADYASNGTQISTSGGMYNFTLDDGYECGADWGFTTNLGGTGYTSDYGFYI